VLAGVTALLASGVAPDTMALVHDAARPGVSAELAMATVVAARGAGAAIPALPVADTLWRVVDGRGMGVVERTGLAGAQTPQAAPLELLRDAIGAALARDEQPTDEAAALQSHGVAVVTVPGDQANRKLTDPGDEEVVRAVLRARLVPGIGEPATTVGARTAIGFDAHRLVPGRPLQLAGLDWPGETHGLDGHSDGDAAFHAVIDALLGAARVGDIGTVFPAGATPAGADSSELLRDAVQRVRDAGLTPAGIDLVIVAARPPIAARRAEIEGRIAELTGLPPEAVSVRGTTSDGLGFAGSEGIAAWASATLERHR
jgi:2-C-methyl-D-erythritol 4-phosphate cytidylyltransferase/2-C-methyl-D-erythritol 2,4-cyclodiphosphate synthase